MDLSIEMLLGPLLSASQSGVVSWEEDPSGGYLTRVGPNTINVYKHEDVTAIRVLDPANQPVDWTTTENSTEQEKLERLYIVAERKARKADVILTDILQRLERAAD